MLFGLLLFNPGRAKADSVTPLNATAGKSGFTISSADGDFVLKIRGYVQSDARFFVNDQPTAIDTFLLRRVRPVFEGTVYRLFDFKIMPDFAGGVTVLQDAYLDARFTNAFKVRFGKAKAPFGLERLQSATDIEFIERSLATNLVPNRDLGIQIYGAFGRDKITYQAALMNGVVDGGSADADSGQGKDFVGRVFVTPIDGMGAGIAYSAGTQQGSLSAPNLPSYKTSGQQTFFKYRLSLSPETTAIASGTRCRYSPQFYLYRGPIGIFAEYVFSSQEIRTSLTSDTIGNQAFNLSAMFVFSGEQATYKGVTPKESFDPANGHFGAWEAVFRYSRLDIDADAFPAFAEPAASATRAKNWTAGLNWYFNKNVKFAFNYDQTNFSAGSLPAEKLFLARFQLAF